MASALVGRTGSVLRQGCQEDRAGPPAFKIPCLCSLVLRSLKGVVGAQVDRKVESLPWVALLPSFFVNEMAFASKKGAIKLAPLGCCSQI